MVKTWRTQKQTPLDVFGQIRVSAVLRGHPGLASSLSNCQVTPALMILTVFGSPIMLFVVTHQCQLSEQISLRNCLLVYSIECSKWLTEIKTMVEIPPPLQLQVRSQAHCLFQKYRPFYNTEGKKE